MQSPSTVSGVSFRKKLRRGQLEAVGHQNVLTRPSLNIKLPTGYGKTLTACGVYSIRQHHGLVSRMLYLVPTRTQLDQFVGSGSSDLVDAGVTGPRQIVDIGYFPGHEVIRRHRKNECQIFAATIQYATTVDGLKDCMELIEQGKWMLCIDEYHHYGLEKTWGQKIKQLQVNFTLAMSATPYRPKKDSAFGEPDVKVTYRQAVDEGAIKPLRGHAYNYKIDALDKDGNVTTYTTDELVKEAGGDSPDAIERFIVHRKMRWSPKYVSPLVYVPITRMEAERCTTGHKLQALVSAMCVSHAELVCGQIRGNFPHLICEWVGTGPNGRSNKENEDLIKRFCPPKKFDGSVRDEPEIDILVHVGMAGEGLDSVNVSEVVMLRSASFNNSTYQIIGRGSRHLSNTTCHVSFDGSTAFALGEKTNGDMIKGVGKDLEYAMDYAASIDTEDVDDEDAEDQNPFPPELPDDPEIHIQDMELLNIDSGDEGVKMMAKLRRSTNSAKHDPVDYDAIDRDPDHPDWQIIIKNYQAMQGVLANQYNEKSVIAQWESSVNSALSTVTGSVLKLMRANSAVRIEKSLIGDIKRRINGRKKAACGPIERDVEVCKRHYHWLVAMDKELRLFENVPSWLE
jgi:superfamily II DNA or RNA helicase